jgi:hypothetical protein
MPQQKKMIKQIFLEEKEAYLREGALPIEKKATI